MAEKVNHEKMKKAMEDLWQAMRHRDDVTGVDRGYKWKDNAPTKQLCLRVHVKQKLPEADLDPKKLLPKKFQGFDIDVIHGPYKKARLQPANSHAQSQGILAGGQSCGRTTGETGTLGMMVINNEDNSPALLSNWHVLVGPHGRVGDLILRPGMLDGGREPQNVVGWLSKHMLDLGGDAAVATLAPGVFWLHVISNTNVAINSVRASRLGEVLTKVGRSTNKTEGRVDGEGRYRVEYEVAPGVDEIVAVEGFKLVPKNHGNPDDVEVSQAGDSGAVWFHESSGAGVGLHFAGEVDQNPLSEHAIACDLGTVMTRLNIRPPTQSDVPTPAFPMAAQAYQMIQAQMSASQLTPHPHLPVPWPCPWPGPVVGPLPGTWPVGPFPRPGPIGPRPTPQPPGWSLIDRNGVLGSMPTPSLKTGNEREFEAGQFIASRRQSALSIHLQNEIEPELLTSTQNVLNADFRNNGWGPAPVITLDTDLFQLLGAPPNRVFSSAVDQNERFRNDGVFGRSISFVGIVTVREASEIVAEIYSGQLRWRVISNE